MKTTPLSHLTDLGACSDAVAWVAASKYDSLETAWLQCERGDWMLWYAGKKSGPPESEGRKKLVLASCECARLARPYWYKRNPDDKQVEACIATAEKWTRGEATIDELRNARSAAYAAAAYAAAAYAAAAYADADAAYAAAAYAADAAYAAYAADAYAANAARTKTLKQCAEIVRKHYSTLPK